MKRGLWLAFAPQTDAKTARDRFLERYGQPPQAVHLVPGALLVRGGSRIATWLCETWPSAPKTPLTRRFFVL